MASDVDILMSFFGKAAYLGYMDAMGFEPHWDALNEEVKQAWIAAADEAMSLQHIIKENKEPDVA